jgi:uncharacterized protein YndB with AHSA1/START domain
MSYDIRIEQFYPHPPERVWRALTDPAALADWLMKSDIKPEPGRRFQFRAKPMPGWRGYVDCEVQQVDEPRRLVYTWRGDDDWDEPTTVTWELEAVEGGTLLRFSHTNFQDPWGEQVSGMLAGGWRKMLEKSLPRVLERIGPQGYTPAPAGQSTGSDD